jgi:hypothetical protein
MSIKTCSRLLQRCSSLILTMWLEQWDEFLDNRVIERDGPFPVSPSLRIFWASAEAGFCAAMCASAYTSGWFGPTRQHASVLTIKQHSRTGVTRYQMFIDAEDSTECSLFTMLYSGQ